MFSMRLFGQTPFAMSEPLTTIEQPIHDRQWNEQCKPLPNVPTWETIDKFESQIKRCDDGS